MLTVACVAWMRARNGDESGFWVVVLKKEVGSWWTLCVVISQVKSVTKLHAWTLRGLYNQSLSNEGE
jgi:hypothetical protein